MSRDFNGSSDYLATSFSPAHLNIITANGPYSMAAWIRPDSVAGDQAVMSKYNGSVGPLLRINSGVINLFAINGASSGQEAIGSTGLSTGVWQHVGGAWDGSSVLKVMLNGAQDGSDTMTSQWTDSAADWTVGTRGNLANYYDGLIAEVALWAAFLTNGEFMALAGGLSPLLVRPGGLRGYWPLWASSLTERSYAGGVAGMTVTGATLGAKSPPAAPFVLPGVYVDVPGGTTPFAVPYISPTTQVFPPTLTAAGIVLPFIASVTTVYTPIVRAPTPVPVPHISSLSTGLYPKGKKAILDGDIDLLADTIRVALIDTSVETYNAADQFLSDITGGAIVGTSAPLTGKTTTGGSFQANNTSVSGSSGDSAEAVLLYQDTGSSATSRLIGWFPITPFTFA